MEEMSVRLGIRNLAVVRHTRGWGTPSPRPPFVPPVYGGDERGGAGEGWGEGARNLAQDRLKHTICIAQHIVIPKPQNPKILSFKIACARIIIRLTIFRMLPTIKLNNQPMFKTDKINNVLVDRHLPAELMAA
jgi:hypothetical protein